MWTSHRRMEATTEMDFNSLISLSTLAAVGCMAYQLHAHRRETRRQNIADWLRDVRHERDGGEAAALVESWERELQ